MNFQFKEKKITTTTKDFAVQINMIDLDRKSAKQIKMILCHEKFKNSCALFQPA